MGPLSDAVGNQLLIEKMRTRKEGKILKIFIFHTHVHDQPEIL